MPAKLDDVPLLNALPEPELAELAAHAATKSFPKNALADWRSIFPTAKNR